MCLPVYILIVLQYFDLIFFALKMRRRTKAPLYINLGGIIIVDNDVNDWQGRRDEGDYPELEDEAPVVEAASKEEEPHKRAYIGVQKDGSGWVAVSANLVDL